MRNHETNQSTGTADLCRLHDLDHYKVADGDPDVRGWDVKTSDGKFAGKVEDLIVDTNTMQVCYLDVELDRKGLKLKEDRHVLVPLANARLDDDSDDVLLGSLTATDVLLLQPYEHGKPVAATRTASHDRDRDPREFYGKRGGTGAVQKMVLSEEELRVGKRDTKAGAVEVHKTVETEHVSKTVPVSHEELQVERRPVSANTAANAKIGKDEVVRIPLNQEEAVIEKRTVPKEEVVISKKVVQGEQTVTADLRKEHLDVDRKGGVERTDDKRRS